MSFRINTNAIGLQANNQLREANRSLAASVQRLSTGKRINKASDDAAGMTIADSLDSQARGMGQAIRNASDAISVTQVAGGALQESANLITTIRTKALQAANGSQNSETRKALQADIDQALVALNDIAQNTSFNGQKLLSGSYTNKEFQVGAYGGETVTVSIGSAEPTELGDPSVGQLSDVNVETQEGAQAAINIADEALSQVNGMRSELGSVQNQLTSTISNLSSSRISVLEAESTIRDLDFADESIIFSKMETLAKAKIFAAAQANKINTNAMKLLLG